MDDEENRLFLQSLLENAFPDVTIYYRPPGNILLNYPCIVYARKAFEPSFSNMSTYVVGNRYEVMLISRLPGYSNVRKMFDLHGQVIIGSNDSYENDDLVHDVFTISVNSIS